MRSSLGLVIALMFGCQGDPQKCEAAVRNYKTLVYWQSADAEIAKAKPADQAALRKQKLADLNRQLERGVPLLVSQCQAANNGDMIRCMIDAKTADQAKACTK